MAAAPGLADGRAASIRGALLSRESDGSDVLARTSVQC